MGLLKNQLHTHKNRYIAKSKGETSYVGSPCPKCGETLRWVANYGCINCGHIKGREIMKTPQGKKWAFNSRIRSKFGLEFEDYMRMFTEQNESCAICKGPFDTGRYKKPYVDHNHDTGKVRALLCNKCNSVLGYVNEDIRILESMIQYLKTHGEKCIQ